MLIRHPLGRAFCESHTNVWQDRRQTSTASWHYLRCWEMCNIMAIIVASGVTIAATWLLEARESLTHVCVCVWVVWQIERERETEAKGRKERCSEVDRNFNWLRDECAKDSVYAFVFSAHMHLNLAFHPCVSPLSKWKRLSCPQLSFLLLS